MDRHSDLPLWNRRRELDVVVNWLLEPDSPAVLSVIGQAGVGKTRLTLQVAREVPKGWTVARLRAPDSDQLQQIVRSLRRPTLIIADWPAVTGQLASMLDVVLARAHDRSRRTAPIRGALCDTEYAMAAAPGPGA